LQQVLSQVNPAYLNINLYKYSIPFKYPFKTANKEFPERDGILLHYRDQDTNVSCWSEASPLPGFSSESLTEVTQASEIVFRSLNEQRNLVTALPSLSFAVDCILWRAGQSGLNRTLMENPERQFIPVPKKMPVNAAIGSGDKDQVLQKVKYYYKIGYRTFKFKVGLDTGREEEILTDVCSLFPDIRIRLDANRSWSLQTALIILSEWKKFNPEYCEEPVHNGIYDHLAQISRSTGVPVAADESVRDIESARILTDGKVVDYLILKPTLIGRISDFLHMCEMAQISGMKVVVTTALESAIGRSWVYALTSTIDNGLAMGLATGNLFEYDICDDSGLFADGHLNFDPAMLNTIQPGTDQLNNLKRLW
jgi:o-succinylbenzoate synthase